MKLLNNVHLLIFTALISFSCNQSEPEITVSGVWSRPVELVDSAKCENENNDKHTANSACCTTDEKTSKKAACCASNVNGVVYLKIENKGGKPDRLLSATSKVAKVVEIHESKMDQDRMSMKKIEEGIEIPGGKTVELKPAGYHIMLIGLKQALKIGDEFSIDLRFEKTAPITVTSNVKIF